MLVFAALDDEGDDLHFFGGEAVADGGSDDISGVHGGDVGAVDGALAAGDGADTVDEVGAGDAAGEDAVEEGNEIVGEVLAVFGDEDEPAGAGGNVGCELGEASGEVGAEGGGEEDDGPAMGVDGRGEAEGFVALGDEADVFFAGEDTCGPCAEDCLIVGQNELGHKVRSPAGSETPCSSLIGWVKPEGMGVWKQYNGAGGDSLPFAV